MTYGDIDAGLAAKLEDLRVAIAHGETRMDQFQIARARQDLTEVQHRLELGTDLTVVALVGGTGSGKSTLFNALTDLDFADAGEIRPTTERASACVWGSGADAMLDFLGVSEERRIRRGSLLTDEEPEFRGMILLDLPDHDSVRVAHSVQVSRLVPMADLLIWVLDPQKYADQVLHDGYLATLQSRADSMIVVLNQIDTVPFGQRNAIVEDVRELLAADGLPDVPVVTSSALNHEGLDELRVHLAAAVAKESINARTAAAELSAIAERLSASVGTSEPVVTEATLRPVARQLSSVSGVGAVTDSIRTAGESWKPTALASPEKPAASSISALRDGLVSTMIEGLPHPWADDVKRAVAGPDRLRRDVGQAVSSVPVTRSRTGNAKLLLGLGVFLLLGALAAVVLWVAAPHLLYDSTLGKTLTVAVPALAGLWSLTSASQVRRASASRHADQYETAAGEKLIAVLDDLIVQPGQRVLDEHRATREALARVAIVSDEKLGGDDRGIGTGEQ